MPVELHSKLSPELVLEQPLELKLRDPEEVEVERAVEEVVAEEAEAAKATKVAGEVAVAAARSR